MPATEEKLAEQIVIAMKDTPRMSLIEMIDRVIQFKYPTRKDSGDSYYMKKSPVKWKLNNADILEAFILYNKIREHDKRRIS